jgi:hypothetical protein
MHHFELSSATSLSSRIFATDFFAASHWLAATNVRKSGARTDAQPQRILRANKCRRPSPSPGTLRWSTVHSAVTRTATQLQMISRVPRVSGPWTQPLKSSARIDVFVLLPSMLAAKLPKWLEYEAAQVGVQRRNLRVASVQLLAPGGRASLGVTRGFGRSSTPKTKSILDSLAPLCIACPHSHEAFPIKTVSSRRSYWLYR